jgi:hypothetical protein
MAIKGVFRYGEKATAFFRLPPSRVVELRQYMESTATARHKIERAREALQCAAAALDLAERAMGLPGKEG